MLARMGISSDYLGTVLYTYLYSTGNNYDDLGSTFPDNIRVHGDICDGWSNGNWSNRAVPIWTSN
jgi:hypothetical protein